MTLALRAPHIPPNAHPAPVLLTTAERGVLWEIVSVDGGIWSVVERLEPVVDVLYRKKLVRLERGYDWPHVSMTYLGWVSLEKYQSKRGRVAGGKMVADFALCTLCNRPTKLRYNGVPRCGARHPNSTEGA